MASDFARTKASIKSLILSGEDNGIRGVGNDRRAGKLAVFSVDFDKSRRAMAGLDSGHYYLRPVIPPSPSPGSSNLFSRILGFLQSKMRTFSLEPARVILPKSGESGCFTCFVEYGDGRVECLSAVHLFHLREDEHTVDLCVGDPCVFKLIGKSHLFASLQTGAGQRNRIDAALFLHDPTRAKVVRHASINGNFVRLLGIERVEGRKVVSLKTGFTAEVDDVDGMASYDVVVDRVTYRLTFDHQIYVRGLSGDIFGTRGDSGALCVLKDGSDAGSALCLYTYSPDSDFHYGTPLYACADEFGFVRIHNPPAMTLRHFIAKLMGRRPAEPPAESAPGRPEHTPRS